MRKLKPHRTVKIILAVILAILTVPLAACQVVGPQGTVDPNTPNDPGTPTKRPTPNVTPIPSGQIVNLMAALKANPDIKVPETDAARTAILNDFAVRLLRAQIAEREKKQENNKNFLLSPYAIQSVLTMVANGAAGDTLTEMLAVLGGEALSVGEADSNKSGGKASDSGEASQAGGEAGGNEPGNATSDADKLRALNELMLGTRRDSERGTQQLFTGGSIWYRTGAEDFRIHPDFLQTNADFFGIPAFAAPFDKETVKTANDLMDGQTKGQIEEFITEFKPENRAVLFSTLLFEGRWGWTLMPRTEQKTDDWFANIEGEKQAVRVMLSGLEPVSTVKGGQAVLNPCSGGKYAMLLILPDEGTLPTDLLKSWTADDWHSAIIDSRRDRNSGNTQRTAAIAWPAFAFGTELDNMIPALQAMGMNLLFDERADLSAMVSGTTDLCISELGHKVRIFVNEHGTIPAASDYAPPLVHGAPPRILRFNRPFAYAIVDLNAGVPYFIGVMNSIDEIPPSNIKDWR